MKAIRTPVDGPQLIKDWLKTRLASEFPSLQVTLRLPEDWKPGDNPVLLIADDTGPDMWPVATSPTIRLTSWTNGRDRKYVNRTMGLLLGSSIPGVAAVLPGTSILDGRDSKNQGHLASFTVRTRMRTT